MDLCGISETHLTDSNDFILDLPSGEKYKIIYSGHEVLSRKKVAIRVNQKLKNRITSVHIVSDRKIAVRIETNPKNVYNSMLWPKLDSDEDSKEQFYSELRDTIKNKLNQEVLIILGNIYSKVGNQKIEDIFDPYGLGNLAGDDLIAFCHENELFLANAWFQQKESARHT